MAPITVPSHAVILQSRLSPLDAPPRFELLLIIWLVVLVTLISVPRIHNHRWSSDSYILVISRATIILTDRGVTTTLPVNVIVVSTVSIYHTLSVIALPVSTHFIRLILNNARWVGEVLDGVPLEGVGWVLQRGGIGVGIELGVALARVKIGWLVTDWGWQLMVSWGCDGFGMGGVGV